MILYYMANQPASKCRCKFLLKIVWMSLVTLKRPILAGGFVVQCYEYLRTTILQVWYCLQNGKLRLFQLKRVQYRNTLVIMKYILVAQM